ncbi:MAG: serine/threonine-protein phosphatase, partial [Bacilli bacterium]|nr:serine/threonine-protein phosphatase [Bacilli bacterium]
SNPEINCSLYFKTNNNDLLALINSVFEMRFNKNQSYRNYIDKHGRVESVTPNGEIVNLFEKVNTDIKEVEEAEKIQVNHRAINKCLGDLMSGVQLKNQRNEYALDGTLYASQDVGKRRQNQEDSVVILTHPENPEFKFLAVADGMGGVDKGEKASSYTLQQISVWFNSLPADAYFYPEQLQTSFNNKLMEISNEIYRAYNADFNRIIAGSTFVGSIVTQDKTIVSSVGDSRAYTTDGQNLNLITIDESSVWAPSMPSNIVTKEALDELRFNKNNNVITRCMGQPLNDVQSTIIQNQDYIRLILMSDGVTDLLSTDRIRILSLSATPETLTKVLVDEALMYDAVRFRGETPNYNGIVPAGKDNATAAAFIRR